MLIPARSGGATIYVYNTKWTRKDTRRNICNRNINEKRFFIYTEKDHIHTYYIYINYLCSLSVNISYLIKVRRHGWALFEDDIEQDKVTFISLETLCHRRRIYTEDTAKVVTASWGDKISSIPFLR